MTAPSASVTRQWNFNIKVKSKIIFNIEEKTKKYKGVLESPKARKMDAIAVIIKLRKPARNIYNVFVSYGLIIKIV